DERGPQQLAFEVRYCRRAGVGTGDDVASLMLAADTPRQHREQHHPPDQKKDGDGGRDRHVSSLAEHDLFGKPVSTFPDHALWRSMIFSENRCPLFRIML